jgi:F-type H+-transporting ATPase subunit gamma
MAEQQNIKRRIKSVRNTRQITRAMQMVAASKLRRAQLAAVGPKAYIEAAAKIMSGLAGTPEALANPLFETRTIKTALTVLVTGDRSLAGAYNSNIFRAFASHVSDQKVPHIAICVGRYGALHVARLSDVSEKSAYPVEVSNSDIELAQPVLTEAVDAFVSGKADVVHLIYTEFLSAIRQEVRVVQILPIRTGDESIGIMTLEPSAEEVIQLAIKRLLEARVLQAILDARASFYAAQMIAMKSATDNAGDLIDDLTLAANNARQAAITQELAEISAGSEAIME